MITYDKHSCTWSHIIASRDRKKKTSKSASCDNVPLADSITDTHFISIARRCVDMAITSLLYRNPSPTIKTARCHIQCQVFTAERYSAGVNLRGFDTKSTSPARCGFANEKRVIMVKL